ncbi:MAG: Rpn family recombination-promoting nuclease/putative transposase, partial [Byssovorax sp.]
GSFVNEDLQDCYSDILYAAHLSGREALIYVLWEHKSEPEPLTPLQVLRYMVRIWDQHLASLPRKKRGEVRKLPVIVPVVLHHGRDGWTAAASFEEMLDADEELLAALGEHVLRLRLIIDDLGKQSDDELYGRAATSFARLVLWALKNAREAGWLGGEIGRWKELIAAVLAERDGTRALTALFRYILQTNPTVEREVLRGLLPEDGGAEVEEAVMNWFEREVDRGRRDGRREGERTAERRVVLKLLRLRFGELPAAVVARVEAAEVPELDVWTERVMTASRLEDVLGTTPA